MRMRFVFLVLLSAVAFDVEAQRARFFLSTIQSEQPEPPSFDSSYQAVLDYASGQGYALPSAGQQILQNQLVLDLKAAGIWDQLDLFYVFATDGDSDYATLNWKDPTQFQCSKVNSPTFTENVGFNGNGSTSYLNLNWDPANNGVNYTLDDADIVEYTTAEQLGGYSGSRNANNAGMYWNVFNMGFSGGNIRINNINSTPVSYTPIEGLYFMGRSDNDTITTRINNGTLLTTTQASVELSSNDVYIGALNSNGSAGNFHSRTSSLVAIGGHMTDLHSAFYNAWTTYLTSL